MLFGKIGGIHVCCAYPRYRVVPIQFGVLFTICRLIALLFRIAFGNCNPIEHVFNEHQRLEATHAHCMYSPTIIGLELKARKKRSDASCGQMNYFVEFSTASSAILCQSENAQLLSDAPESKGAPEEFLPRTLSLCGA